MLCPYVLDFYSSYLGVLHLYLFYLLFDPLSFILYFYVSSFRKQEMHTIYMYACDGIVFNRMREMRGVCVGVVVLAVEVRKCGMGDRRFARNVFIRTFRAKLIVQLFVHRSSINIYIK